MNDFMSVTNNFTITDIEKCKDKDDLHKLIVRRQPSDDIKIPAGGVLNYLHEAYQYISLEEKSKDANK